MKILFVYLFQALLQLIYLPLKAFCKVQDQVVYLSRQSNEKSLDMQLLEQAIEAKAPGTRQVFRLQMMEDGFAGKLRYFGHLVGDMKALASSKVVIVDTYSIAVSCLRHKAGVQVVQMWHALGAVKKFGLQSLGTKEGRDARLSHAMHMHRGYDYVLCPSAATARFYMEAFGCPAEKIKICSLPRVDDIVTPKEGLAQRLYAENPGAGAVSAHFSRSRGLCGSGAEIGLCGAGDLSVGGAYPPIEQGKAGSGIQYPRQLLHL